MSYLELGGWLLPRWVLLLSICGYPLLAGISAAAGLENRPLSIAFRSLVIVIALAAISHSYALGRNRSDRVFWTLWWIFWCTYLFRMAFDLTIADSARNFPWIEYVGFSIGGGLVPALAMAYSMPDRVCQSGARYLVWLSLAGVLINGWVVVFEEGLIGVLQLAGLRAESQFLNPIALGHLGVTLSLGSLWSMVRMVEPGNLERAFFLACLIVGLVVLVASGSRGPTLSLVVCIALLVVMERRRLRAAPTIALAVLLGIPAYLVLAEIQASFWFDRLSQSALQDDTRVQLMQTAWDSFLESPVLGAGIDPHFSYPHNLVIEAFMAGGLLTGLTFVGILGYAAAVAIRAWSSVRNESWVLLLYFQYAVGAMVSGSLYTSTTLWVLMVAVVSLWELYRRDDIVRLVALVHER